jgi:hypothetical protein
LRCNNIEQSRFAFKSAIVADKEFPGEANMKTFIIACAAAIVIAIIGGVVINGAQETADKAFSSPTGVRLGA